MVPIKIAIQVNSSEKKNFIDKYDSIEKLWSIFSYYFNFFEHSKIHLHLLQNWKSQPRNFFFHVFRILLHELSVERNKKCFTNI